MPPTHQLGGLIDERAVETIAPFPGVFRLALAETHSEGMDLQAFDEYSNMHNGLVTRQANKDKQFTDRSWYRAIDRGLIELLHPGVARLHGTPRTREQQIHAAVLAAGRGAMASHRSAAHLWGIGRPTTDPVDVLLPKRTRQATLADVEVHRPRDLLDLNPARRSNIPVTNILRTLCDLGAVEPAAMPGAVGHVVSTGLASLDALYVATERHRRRGRAGVPALRDALEEYSIDGKPADSILEPAMHELLAAHGLPAATFHPVIGGHEVDFLVTDSMLILECDGWTSHGLNRDQFERDRARDAELAALGHVVLRFTYREIKRAPKRTASRIRRNVARWAPHLLAG